MLCGLSREAVKSKPVLSLLKPLGALRRWAARAPACPPACLLPACHASLPQPLCRSPHPPLQSTACRTTRAARTSWVGVQAGR